MGGPGRTGGGQPRRALLERALTRSALAPAACSPQTGPRASLYLTLVGILAGFLSTLWNFGYTRTGLKMQQYLDSGGAEGAPKVKKQNVRAA
jgi:hypothetical protein